MSSLQLHTNCSGNFEWSQLFVMQEKMKDVLCVLSNEFFALWNQYLLHNMLLEKMLLNFSSIFLTSWKSSTKTLSCASVSKEMSYVLKYLLLWLFKLIANSFYPSFFFLLWNVNVHQVRACSNFQCLYPGKWDFIEPIAKGFNFHLSRTSLANFVNLIQFEAANVVGTWLWSCPGGMV